MPDSEIIYNSYIDGEYAAIVMEINTGSAVSFASTRQGVRKLTKRSPKAKHLCLCTRDLQKYIKKRNTGIVRFVQNIGCQHHTAAAVPWT